MFDQLRDNQRTRPGDTEKAPAEHAETRGHRAAAGFLGMTSGQRLAVAILLLIAVCLLGTTCLLATGAIGTF